MPRKQILSSSHLTAFCLCCHVLVWEASDPNDIGLAVAEMAHPLVGVGVATGPEGQPEEANLEAGARVPGKFKGEACGSQPQWRG